MPEQTVRTGRRNRNWIWFFAAVAVLAVVAILLLRYASIRFGQVRLTPERLEEARKLWEEKGPISYELVYTKRLGRNDPEKYVVRVRNGVPESVTRNDKPMEKRLYEDYTMTALFRDLWGFLKEDEKPGAARTTTWARFDDEDGHVQSYGRLASSNQADVEVQVEELRKL
jgi:hypothetical protein